MQVKGIVDYLGKDASKVFPRAPPITLPQKCLDMEKVRAYELDIYSPDKDVLRGGRGEPRDDNRQD